MTKRRRHGKRFRLLLYERMWQRWAWPCILTVPASIALWWFAPKIRIIYPPLYPLTLFPALAALAILAYTYLARRTAWVQCRAGNLRIQTPFYPLVVSYRRIKRVHPSTFASVFNPAQEKPARRQWLQPYWSHTVVVVELSNYPVHKAWLKLWFSPYMLNPDVPGFVFVVEDWMALSRQLDEFRTAWEMRRAERRRRILAERTH